MAAPTIYRSSDTSAPTLSGTAGDLVNVLDKCLVAGYGSKTAAGWTKPFTATNAAVFRQGAGNQFYLNVSDSGASSGLTGASGKEAAVRAYETMTAVGTGTNPFPTTAQVAAATASWRKSATADATTRAWFVIADDRSFILGILDGDTAGIYKLYVFGDMYSLKTGDGYRTHITVRTVVNSTAATGSFGGSGVTNLGTGIGTTGLYVARISDGSGTAFNAGMVITGSAWETAVPYPALDNNLYLSRILITDAAGSAGLRAWLRGLYEILTPIGLNDGDTFSGTGDFAGRAFIVVKGFAGNTGVCLAVETTAWDTAA